jgi:hypothetical protein
MNRKWAVGQSNAFYEIPSISEDLLRILHLELIAGGLGADNSSTLSPGACNEGLCESRH